MSIETCVADLREAADQLEAIRKRLALPVQDVDIPGAFAKLASVIGKDAHICISVEFDNLNVRYGSNGKLKVAWSIYDGSGKAKSHRHEAATLADVVNLCLAAHQPPKEGDAAREIEIVTDSLAEPLPI